MAALARAVLLALPITVATEVAAPAEASGGGAYLEALLLAAEPEGSGNTTEAWRQQLTAEQRQELDARLAQLRSKAAREEAYARQDGPQELRERQQEYARKEARLLDEFRRKVAAAQAEASGAGAGTEALLLAAELAGSGNRTEAWRQQLTAEPRQELDVRLAQLRSKAVREEAYARLDGRQELRERQQEYAKKEAQLLDEFKRKVAVPAGASGAGAVAEALLLAAEPAGSGSSREAWRQQLTAEQRRELDTRLAQLRTKAAREEAYAREDGPQELRERQQEYARKEVRLFDEFRRKVAAPAEASGAGVFAETLLLAAEPDGSGHTAEAWRQQLTAEQRQELDTGLAQLRSKAVREEAYARQDGPQELRERQQEYAKKEARFLNGFKRKVAEPAKASGTGASAEALLLAAELAGRGNTSNDWRQQLTAEQRRELDARLSQLRTKAAREEAYAREDGPQEFRERQQEYARKEARLLDKFRRKDAAPAEASSAGAGTEAVLLAAEPSGSGGEAEALRQQLTAEQRQVLDARLAQLRIKAKREEAYARQDGVQELKERQHEYAKKETRLLDEFRREVAVLAEASGAGAGSLLLAAEPMELGEAAGAWRQRLTAEQRRKLEDRLAELRRKAVREEAYAREDGAQELSDRQQEYAQKEECLLDAFRRKAAWARAEFVAKAARASTSSLSAVFGSEGLAKPLVLAAAAALPVALGALALVRPRAAAADLHAPLMEEP